MNPEQAQIESAIAALASQRATLGDAVLELATAPLRAQLAQLAEVAHSAHLAHLTSLQRPTGLQHRQVTVLFADVVGSTAMAQSLDAEDTLAVLSGALQRMAALVQAHQGRVLRFTGDGLKAAFGMDDSREDDAERAVRAGLAILESGREQAAAARRLHGIADFAVRVGVHTGDVALGAGVENDNTAMGAAVNIAARMERSAPPGALRISHDSWSQVRGLFDVEPQPPLQVKGVEAPMQTYLVRAALERSVVSVERGLQGLNTPMVGRQAELQRLLQFATQARQTKQLQALTLLGDAGLGKSRLLREFRAVLSSNTESDPSSDPSSSQLLTVRAQPDSQLRPWGLLRSVLAVQCFVADTDSAEVARRKVVDGLSPWFAEPGERSEFAVRQAQLIGQLSGLDFADSPNLKGLDPRTLRDQALAAFRSYLHALATRGDALLVLLVEDLHWCDDSSLDLMQHLLTHAAELPLLLVMTARPTLLARRPDWGTSDTLLTLHPLAAAQGDELARALLQRMAEVPPRLMELISGQAEGNPYYMEELVRRLIDDGVIITVNTTDGAQWAVQVDRLDTLRLPTTLVGLLQARLDALPAAERQAARQASVIGHVFWDDALQALDASAPQALPALQRATYVREHETSDFEGTPERQFDHHLLHQVTYGTLLKAERRLGHGTVARWLAERTQGRGAEFLAMTGEHAERAGEVALAADCFAEAAREARNRYANSAATSWLARAVALLGETQPALRFELLDRLQTIADTVGDRVGQDAGLAAMTALLERHPDDALQARLWLALALLADRRTDTATAERLSLQAVELAERCGAAHTAARAQGSRAWFCLARQDHLGAVGPLESGLLWARRIEAADQRAEIEAKLLTLSGIVSAVLCHFDEARQTLTEVLALGESLGLPRLQLGAMDNLAMVASRLGYWDEAMTWGERMCPLAQATGAAPDLAGALLRQAQAAGSKGEHAKAIRLHGQNLLIVRGTGNRRQEAVTLRYLGASHLAQGDAHGAAAWFAQAQAVYAMFDEPVEASDSAAEAALCQLRLGHANAALAMVDALLERLAGDLAPFPVHQTIELRWNCQQVIAAVGDARAESMLEQLFADVKTRADELTDAADRDRLIQALPVFRAIVAARGGLGTAAAAS